MTPIPQNSKQKIRVGSIDIEDDFYKISKNRFENSLRKSIETLGIIELPLLIKNNEKYRVIFGHNRLCILNDLGIEFVDSIVAEKIDAELFLKHIFLKSYRNEIGPIGRVKFIQILKNKFNFDNDALASAAANINLPMQFLQTPLLCESVTGLPDTLKDYIDYKDIGFKVIMDILRLPSSAIILLDKWVGLVSMRANIFRKIVSHLVDIDKRNATFFPLEKIDLDPIEDRRVREDCIYEEVFRLRYPEYTELRENALNIIGRIETKGLDITFPEYFESDEIGVRFCINRRDGIESFRNRFDAVDTFELKKLLDLL